MFTAEELLNNTSHFYLGAKDLNHKFLYCNENYARGMGLDSPAQIRGKTDFHLYNDALARLYQKGDAQVFRGNTFLNQVEAHSQNNQPMQILTSKHQLKNKSGAVIGVVVSFIDITGQGISSAREAFTFDETLQRYRFKICGEDESFSPQEFRVFRGIMLGLSANEIAQRMRLSCRTVEDYINKIRYKLQCESKFHIIEMAIRHGLTCRLDNL